MSIPYINYPLFKCSNVNNCLLHLTQLEIRRDTSGQNVLSLCNVCDFESVQEDIAANFPELFHHGFWNTNNSFNVIRGFQTPNQKTPTNSQGFKIPRSC
jgi:hypothetical protein